MRSTVVPLCALVAPQFYVFGPLMVLLCYGLAFRSPITRHLLSTQRWMKQMLFYVIPVIYLLGAAVAIFSASAAKAYALVAVFLVTWLWHRCYRDYLKHHYEIQKRRKA
ncbi:MAG TPA: hypothetical protein VGM16_06195 [Gammaproteobacteria bacterium]|jgi:hypothetical protein